MPHRIVRGDQTRVLGQSRTDDRRRRVPADDRDRARGAIMLLATRNKWIKAIGYISGGSVRCGREERLDRDPHSINHFRLERAHDDNDLHLVDRVGTAHR
jgi:hypothetical protein